MSYFNPETKKAKKIAIAIKGLAGALGASAAIASYPYVGLGIFVLGAIADEAIKFLSDDTEQKNQP